MVLARFCLFWLLLSIAAVALPAAETNLSHYMHSRRHIAKSVWQQVEQQLLPWDSSLRKKLDEFFGGQRIILSPSSLKKAGFRRYKPRHYTRLIVTTHPVFAGYVFKLYLDCQSYHHAKKEHLLWLERISGARLISAMIAANGWQDLFKVPQKWVYPLPMASKAVSTEDYARKDFILVEEDMDIYSEKENRRLWAQGTVVSEKMLLALFSILSELGLSDCVKPANIPISRDGRIAFIDTQLYHQQKVPLHELIRWLPRQQRPLWRQLVRAVQRPSDALCDKLLAP